LNLRHTKNGAIVGPPCMFFVVSGYFIYMKNYTETALFLFAFVLRP